MQSSRGRARRRVSEDEPPPKLEATERRTRLLRDLVVVGSLNLGRDTNQRLSEGVLGSGVHHLGLDLCAIGGPAVGGRELALDICASNCTVFDESSCTTVRAGGRWRRKPGVGGRTTDRRGWEVRGHTALGTPHGHLGSQETSFEKQRCCTAATLWTSTAASKPPSRSSLSRCAS